MIHQIGDPCSEIASLTYTLSSTAALIGVSAVSQP